MVLHGLKRIFQKPTPDLSSSDRTNQLRSKTVYSGTVELSKTLDKPDNNRYKTYNGPFEIAKKNLYTDATLVASTSYKDLLDITKGKVLSNQLPLTNLTYPYYEKNFGNGELYVGNYQQFDGSKFHTSGPTGCIDSILVYDLSTTGFTGRNSYSENSIGYPGPTGMLGSNQDIFIDPKHCYYSDPCASSASYMNFVEIDFKSPTGTTGATGITGSSQYFAQQIINGNQYSGFRFPMSNFTLTCKQPFDSQEAGPLFCPALQPTLSGFSIPSVNYSPSPSPFTILPPPTSNSAGAFSYTSSNPSVATINGNTITTGNAGTVTITATQAASGIYSSGTITTTFTVGTASPTFSPWTISSVPYNSTSFQITPPMSTSTGAFSYTVTGPSPLPSISNNTVDITGVNVGTYTITATQAASGNYASGSTPASFNVTPIAPTFTGSWTVPSSVNYSPTPSSFQITPPTSNSGGAFSYVSNNPSVTFSGNNVNINSTVNIGTYTITATQALYGNYTSGIPPQTSFTVIAIAPTFTGSWTVPPSVNYSPTPSSFQITPPTSNSGGTFSYASNNPSVTFSGNNVNINSTVNVGTYTITATQALYGNYTSGIPPQTSFTVITIAPTISFLLTSINANTQPFSLSQQQYTTSNSLGAFTFSSNNTSVAYITNGNILNLTGVKGNTDITITQAADGNYSTGYSTAFPVLVFIPVSIYNISADGLTSSSQDPPQWGAAMPGQSLVFGRVNTINNGEILVQATFDNQNGQYTLTYDVSKNLYLYFYSTTFFYATNTRVATVTFPPILNPNYPSTETNQYNQRSNPYVFPTPLTWTYQSGTYYTIWSQINPDGTGGNQNNLSMEIENTSWQSNWQWSGNLYIQSTAP
jgi:hypothetical protein